MPPMSSSALDLTSDGFAAEAVRPYQRDFGARAPPPQAARGGLKMLERGSRRGPWAGVRASFCWPTRRGVQEVPTLELCHAGCAVG